MCEQFTTAKVNQLHFQSVQVDEKIFLLDITVKDATVITVTWRLDHLMRDLLSQ